MYFILTFCVDSGRQTYETAVPVQQLPVFHEGAAVHVQRAPGAQTGLEPDAAQPCELHDARIRHQLYGDTTYSDPRQLSHTQGILFGSSLRGRGAS